jgi:hypothetical protein
MATQPSSPKQADIVRLMKKLVRIVSPSDLAKFVSKLHGDPYTLRKALAHYKNEDDMALVNFVNACVLETAIEIPQKKVI